MRLNRLYVPEGKLVPQISQLDFAQLENISRVRFNETQRKELLSSLNNFLFKRLVYSDPINDKKVKARLKKIRVHALALENVLANEGTADQAILDACFPFNLADLVSWKRVLPQLASSSAACEKTIGKRTRGRSQDVDLDDFITKVKKIFYAAGGKTKGSYYNSITSEYSGRLTDLICELLEEGRKIGGPDFSRNTVGQKI